MLEDFVRPEIRALEAYVPGRSIEEIRQEYGIEKVIKMARNENPLGTGSPRPSRRGGVPLSCGRQSPSCEGHRPLSRPA